MGNDMREILVISPFGFMTEAARQAVGQLALDNVELIEANVFNTVEIARRALERGTKTIISRGGVFDLLRLHVDVPVIEVEVTAFDLIEAFSALNVQGRAVCVGVVGFQNVIGNAGMVAEAMRLNARITEIADGGEVADAVDALAAAGIHHFLGDSEVGSAVARHHGVFSMVRSGVQAMRYALRKAVDMLEASRRQKERAQLFASVIDLVSDGIIAVDSQSRITVFNRASEKLFGARREGALGRKIHEVLKEARMPCAHGDWPPENGGLLELRNGVTVLANRAPVEVEGKALGAVATYRDVGEVQNLERKIRIQLSERGFVAQYDFSDIVHVSESISECIRTAVKFSKYDTTVLVSGASGVGKELFAQGIHNHSGRKNSPFVAINCAALPEPLIESELFGYAEGAFTGANRKGKAGLFEMAHGGTLFLDEISELPIALQGRLLRALQEKEVMRIGDNKLIPVDVRIICATNRDLLSRVKEKCFRSDLYFRIATLRLDIPELNQRPEDIDCLANHFLRLFEKKYRKPSLTLKHDAIRYLRRHVYEGNVRELRGMVERAVILSEGGAIEVADLAVPGRAECAATDAPDGGTPWRQFQLQAYSLADVESEYIEHVFRSTQGSVKKASEILGIGRSTLWRKVKALDIQPQWQPGGNGKGRA